MNSKSAIALIALTFATAGCDLSGDPGVLGPVAPAAMSSSATIGPSMAASQAASTAPVTFVSGGAVVDWSAYDGGRDKYTFHASLDGEGRVDGRFRSSYLYTYTETESFRFDADVVCLAVDGGHAWLGLEITRSTDPVFLPVGTTGVVRVFDAGEGHHLGNADDPYDKDAIGTFVTSVGANGCEPKPTLREFWYLDYIDQGNIHVR
jgi:hypothetical protein